MVGDRDQSNPAHSALSAAGIEQGCDVHPRRRRGCSPWPVQPPVVTGQCLLVGLLGMIAVGVSFGLTVLFFGFVVLAGLLIVVTGLAFAAAPGRRRTATKILGVGAATLSGPVVYVALAVLQSLL